MGLFDSLFGKKSTPSPSSASTPASSNIPAQTQPAAEQKKVLIVEDEKLLANALEMKFSHANYLVAKAENGQIGLEQAQKFKPDVIILDLMMPVMDGKTMLHKLREIPELKMLPVVVLTNAG